MHFDPWLLDAKPAPRAIRELERLVQDDRELSAPRPDDLYWLKLGQGTTLNELDLVMSILHSEGYVGVVLESPSRSIRTLFLHSPSDLSPIGAGHTASVPIVTVFEVEHSIFVTSHLLMLDAQSHIVWQKEYPVEMFAEQCPPRDVLDELATMCSDPRQPCQRVVLSGSSNVLAAPLLGTLGAFSEVGHPPRVISTSTAPTTRNTRAMRESGSWFSRLLDVFRNDGWVH